MGMAAVAGVWSEAAARGAESPREWLLVLAKTDHTLSMVDPETRQVVFRAPSGPDPHEVIASDDGKYAYISNYGGGAYNTITVVDLVGRKSLPAIDLGALRGPHGLAYAGGKLWFTAEGAKVIGSWDPATQKVDWVLGTGQDRTHMIFVAPDLKHLVTSNVSSGTMTMIEKNMNPQRPQGPPPGARRGGGPGGGGPPPGGGGPPPGGLRAEWEEVVVPVGHGAEGFDISPDGKEIWAANAQDGTISIIDVAAKKVTDTLQANVESANRLKFTPDGRQVFVSLLAGSDVVVFDAQSRKDVKHIQTGNGAAGILMAGDGSRAYVACTPDDYVAVIDLRTLAVVGKVDAGKQPDGLAWAVRK